MIAGTLVGTMRAGLRRRVATLNIQGLVPYSLAWQLQQKLVAQRIVWQKEEQSGFDAMLVLEHSPVYTLGRSAKPGDVKFPLVEGTGQGGRGFEVFKTDRGGQVTWHGPGQIVIYPVVDLTHHKKDLRWYVRGLEEVVLRVLALHGVEGQRDEKHTGVWVKEQGPEGEELTKVAAIGVSASRWVTCHGLALNVDPDLRAFESIVPCGVRDRRVGCLNNLLSPHAAAELTTAQVRYELMEAFEDVFPSMELCVQEKKDQLKGTVDEMVLEDEEREDYV
ncbi:hypothetical protein NSK_002940 [Nannochloropsis salina CCMP1776]|uniref:lipoyl(octanoyl) transferase n=1 Tax=Nannochloropsis salina CCMP1776 TaxID=1027361 RepID=A0A4D9D3V9_9STRA|nr:hypothetical protein NSK_002940 [Nannochloropsis salina CCMP1776]|eukprot:TFJ86120.1 hypothetical protein NSK_002940 [Nannochloropsis salina CCMP1776]